MVENRIRIKGHPNEKKKEIELIIIIKTLNKMEISKIERY
jgi:hypothetical protein